MTAAAVFIGVALGGLVLACGAVSFTTVDAARRVRVAHRLGLTGGSQGRFRNRVSAAPSGADPFVGSRSGAAPFLDRVIDRLSRAFLGHRRAAERGRALAPAVEGIARSLRAGGSVRTALADSATGVPPPLGDELGQVVAACDQGIPMRQAIERWAAATPTADVRLIAAALVLGVDAGAGLARTLDGVAATLYERAAIEREARALSTQARYSAAVLAVAPLVFLAVMAALDASTLGFLLGTPAGLACLGLGLGLDIAGGWWMARITRTMT